MSPELCAAEWWFPAGDGILSLYNVHLNESLTVQYRNNGGYYNKEALRQVQHLLRCRHTRETQEIPVELLELVDQIQDHFGPEKTVEVISGYRSPELNQMLRRQGRGVAKHSLHMQGHAIDIRIPGVSTQQLRNYALSLGEGGVGYYPQNRFVHVDIGRIRSW